MGTSNNVQKGVIYLGNRIIECDIQSVNLEASMDEGYRTIGGGYMSEPIYTRVEMTGIVRKLIDKGENMCERACGYDGECESSSESLSTKYKNLDLDDNTRKLRKYGLIRLDGTLTDKGKDFLLNYLLEQNSDELVEALEAIEEAEKEEKKSCE